MKWAPGLTFAVPLPDGSFAVGQTSELMMANVGYCALFSTRVLSLDAPPPHPNRRDVVALLGVVRHGITSGHWPVLAAGPAVIPKAEFPNERFASAGYIGATVYDFALAQQFLVAYHGLAPWNDSKDPNYFDTMLAPNVARPSRAQILNEVELATYRAATRPSSERGAV